MTSRGGVSAGRPPGGGAGRVVDLEGVRRATHDLLMALGEDPSREGLVDTPTRVSRAWAELLGDLGADPAEHLETRFDLGADSLIFVRNIDFHSVCEHHLLPFFGVAHIAYLPSQGVVTGLSKLARLVRGYAGRLQVQERLTEQIAEALSDRLGAKGVGVIVEATHLCMAMRGVRSAQATTVTSALRGRLRTDPASRAEFMSLVQGRHV